MMQQQMYTGYFEKNDIERWTKDGDGPKTVKMPVYFNGLYYTCPDPADESRCESIFKQYQNGMFITQDFYEISKKAYCMLRYGTDTKPAREGPNKILDGGNDYKYRGYASASTYDSIKETTDFVYQSPEYLGNEFTQMLIQKYVETLNYTTFQEAPEVIARGYNYSDWNDYALATSQ